MSNLSIPAANLRVEMQAPIHAELSEIINWDHPQLRGADRQNPGAALLAAWRKPQDCRWIFDRSDIDAMLATFTADEIKSGAKDLAYLHSCLGKPQELDVNIEERRPDPIPFDKQGRPVWECYTEANAEYVCVANRFHWMPVAAAAARRNGNPADAELLFTLIETWISDNPIPVDVIETEAGVWPYWKRAWAPLSSALRAKNWLFVLHLLWDSPSLNAERFGRIIRSLRQHLIWQGRASPRVDKTAEGNHFLMESEGLLFISTLTWLKEAVNPNEDANTPHEIGKDGYITVASAREAALGNFTRCLNNQVLPDGVHIECTPGYHRGCMLWFGLPILFCKLNHWPIAEELVNRVYNMMSFGLNMIQPNGFLTASGDCSRYNDAWSTEWFLARMAGRELPVPAQPSGGVYRLVRNWPEVPKTAPVSFPLATRFPNGGFAIARNSWKNDASALHVKLDGFGGAHSHADFLGVKYCYKGRLMIDEQGTHSYNNDATAVGCKKAPAHSVLLLGNRDMFSFEKPDSYWDGKPCVKISEIACTTHPDGSMQTGARIHWDEHTWWRRDFDFDAQTGGLLIRDQIAITLPESVRIQFYVFSTHVELDGACGIRTTDVGQPNIALSVKGTPPGTKIEITPALTYNGFFNSAAISLVTVHIPACTSGTWETRLIPTPV